MLFVKDFLSDQQVFRATNAPQAPLVSVILPTYARYKNGYLQRAIESVLAQTFKDFEFLIVDDGSRDGSKGFIEQCLAADPRVVHIRHERNSGLHAIRMNEGIELARGQYLAFQFDDDSWRPLALQALVTEASRHAEPTVIVGHCHAKGKTSQVVFPYVEPNFSSLYETNILPIIASLFPVAWSNNMACMTVISQCAGYVTGTSGLGT